MYSYQNNKGFSLIEIMLAMTLAATFALFNLQNDIGKLRNQNAEKLGIEIFKIGNALQTWLSIHSGDIASLTLPMTENGMAFLKMNTCALGGGGSGTADREYLSCDFLKHNNELTSFGDLDFTVTIDETIVGGLSKLEATIVFDELTLTVDGGQVVPALDLSGRAAMVAANAWTVPQDDASTVTTSLNSVFCVTQSLPQCVGNLDRIVVLVTTMSANDRWLRIDHGNNMQNIIEFESTIAGLDPDGFSIRQIKNVARLLNSVDNNNIIIGSKGLFDMTELLAAGITDTLALDSDLLVYGTAVIINDTSVIGGDLVVSAGTDSAGVVKGGSITANQGSIKAIEVLNTPKFASSLDLAGNVLVDNDIYAGGDSFVLGDATFQQDIYGKQLIDYDNTSYLLDPDGQSNLFAVEMDTIIGTSTSGTSRLYIDAETIDFGISKVVGDVDVSELVVESTSGVKVPLKDLLSPYVFQSTQEVSHGETITKPDCSSGVGVPKVFMQSKSIGLKTEMLPHVFDDTPDEDLKLNGSVGYWEIGVVDNGTTWTASIQSSYPIATYPDTPDGRLLNGRAVAQIYCLY